MLAGRAICDTICNSAYQVGILRTKFVLWVTAEHEGLCPPAVDCQICQLPQAQDAGAGDQGNIAGAG